MRKTLPVLLKAIFWLILLPVVLLRVDGRMQSGWPDAMALSWPAMKWTGTALMVLGAYVAVRAYLILAALGKGWPHTPTVFLVNRYIYRFVRHPQYWGYTVFWFGMGLRRASLFLTGFALFLGILFTGYVLLFEDPQLKMRFGVRFADYRRQIPLISPLWRELYYDLAEYNWFLLLTVSLVRKVFPFLWNVRAEGLENIPHEGGCVVVCNHVNYVDPFLIGMFFTRPIRFMASDELFRKPVTRILFTLWRAFPKRRWSRDVAALRKLRNWVADGNPVGLFPEGQRNWDGGPVGVGEEVYRFLYHCQAPVLCASLIGGHEAFPRWARLPSFTDLTVRFFPLIHPSEFTSVTEFRKAVETRIFDFVNAPPARRRVYRSHQGITVVAWGCLKCGGVRTLRETRGGLVCQKCGAAWEVTERLEFIECDTRRVMLERKYHELLKARLGSGMMEGGLASSSPVMAYRILDSETLQPVGPGQLTLNSESLVFHGSEVTVAKPLKAIHFAYLNLANHLVVNDGEGAMQYAFVDDSPVRWEDYVSAARKAAASAGPPEWARQQVSASSTVHDDSSRESVTTE